MTTAASSQNPSKQTMLAEWAFNPTGLKNAIIPDFNALAIPLPLIGIIVDYLQDRTNVFCAKEMRARRIDVPEKEEPKMSQENEARWQRLKSTHICVYIPKTINEKPFNFDNIFEIMKTIFPATQIITSGGKFRAVQAKSIDEACLIVIPQKLFPSSQGTAFDTQKEMIIEHARVTNIPYTISKQLDIITFIFAMVVGGMHEPCKDKDCILAGSDSINDVRYAICFETREEGQRVAIGFNTSSNKFYFKTIRVSGYDVGVMPVWRITASEKSKISAKV